MFFLMVEQKPVLLLRGGSRILRGDETIGKTQKGETWIAHSVFWDEDKTPMLWMLSVMAPGVGAWAKLKDTQVHHGEPSPRTFPVYF